MTTPGLVLRARFLQQFQKQGRQDALRFADQFDLVLIADAVDEIADAELARSL